MGRCLNIDSVGMGNAANKLAVVVIKKAKLFWIISFRLGCTIGNLKILPNLLHTTKLKIAISALAPILAGKKTVPIPFDT